MKKIIDIIFLDEKDGKWEKGIQVDIYVVVKISNHCSSVCMSSLEQNWKKKKKIKCRRKFYMATSEILGPF